MPEDHVFTLNGDERWLIRFTTLKGAAYGYTFSQKAKNPRIILDARMRGRKKLEVVVHELLQRHQARSLLAYLLLLVKPTLQRFPVLRCVLASI